MYEPPRPKERTYWNVSGTKFLLLLLQNIESYGLHLNAPNSSPHWKQVADCLNKDPLFVNNQMTPTAYRVVYQRYRSFYYEALQNGHSMDNNETMRLMKRMILEGEHAKDQKTKQQNEIPETLEPTTPSVSDDTPTANRDSMWKPAQVASDLPLNRKSVRRPTAAEAMSAKSDYVNEYISECYTIDLSRRDWKIQACDLQAHFRAWNVKHSEIPVNAILVSQSLYQLGVVATVSRRCRFYTGIILKDKKKRQRLTPGSTIMPVPELIPESLMPERLMPERLMPDRLMHVPESLIQDPLLLSDDLPSEKSPNTVPNTPIQVSSLLDTSEPSIQEPSENLESEPIMPIIPVPSEQVVHESIPMSSEPLLAEPVLTEQVPHTTSNTPIQVSLLLDTPEPSIQEPFDNITSEMFPTSEPIIPVSSEPVVHENLPMSSEPLLAEPLLAEQVQTQKTKQHRPVDHVKQSIVNKYISECYTIDLSHTVPAQALQTHFRQWNTGKWPLHTSDVSAALLELGIKKEKSGSCYEYRGLCFKPAVDNAYNDVPDLSDVPESVPIKTEDPEPPNQDPTAPPVDTDKQIELERIRLDTAKVLLANRRTEIAEKLLREIMLIIK